MPNALCGYCSLMITTTALIAVVPEAEPVVGVWRERYDPSAAEGVPAHVTVLYPFLPFELVDTSALAELFAAWASFDVEFRGFGHFPGVLYLAPEPAEPFRELTTAVAERWPEAPPYGGAFPDVVPHLTVADR
ncbi:MAG: 2'-5' RNA ligase family protein, partial [Nonomuraea sp.]|nr:2'-5' RNA ligase family protein [Nonomuraea sp.]